MKSFGYFKSAAGQNYPGAENMIGAFYGMASPKHQAGEHDPVEAVRWHQRGAEHGDVAAMTNLATAYSSGLGVAIDPFHAFVWAGLVVQCSTIRNRPDEVLRDRAANELEANQRAAADRRVSQLRITAAQPRPEPMTYWKSLSTR